MIRVRIDRLVLDAPIGDRAALARAVEAELARLLGSRPPALTTGSSVGTVRAPDAAPLAGHPAELGRQIAGAVHAALSGPGLPPHGPGPAADAGAVP